MIHRAVLLHESIDGLNLASGKIYFDGTLGAAGHAQEVFKRFGDAVEIIGTDRNESAVAHAEDIFAKLGNNHHFIVSDYRNIDVVLAKLGIEKVDAILLDLGLSSDELDASGRGFTFKNNEPLLMTFSENPEVSPRGTSVTAQVILNNWKEETIADILYGYSDERYARRIAKAIVEARKTKEIVRGAVPAAYTRGKTHFATKTFQALRIAVNDEITALKEGMLKGFEVLNTGGRMAIISFHSVEDREVKNFFRNKSKEKLGKLINKKPITATEAELEENPRSRSAKLRVIEKI